MKDNLILSMILVSIISLGFGLISFIHVPYIRSNLVESVAYYVILPISTVPLLVVVLKYVNKRVLKSKFLLSELKAKLMLSFILPLFMTWFSLYSMAWPTYWFASNETINEITIIGADSRNSKGGYSFHFLLSQRNERGVYDILISEALYQTYISQCVGSKVPIKSKSWWAGSIVKEQSIQRSIKTYCVG